MLGIIHFYNKRVIKNKQLPKFSSKSKKGRILQRKLKILMNAYLLPTKIVYALLYL